MANDEHIAQLKKGVDAWNAWRKENPDGPDLSGANLSGAKLVRTDLSGADFTKANLAKADLMQANLSEARLGGADLSTARLVQASLRGTNLRGAKLCQARLVAADLSGAHLSGANCFILATLRGADTDLYDLTEADVREAILRGAYWWTELDLQELRLLTGKYDARRFRLEEISEAILDRPGELGGSDHLSQTDLMEILSAAHLSWVPVNTGSKRDTTYLIEAQLGSADLSKAELRKANLREAKGKSALFVEANLSEAMLNAGDLRNADLSRARLSGADLSEAILIGAKLSEADLSTDIYDKTTNLSGADLTFADLRSAKCARANLSGARLTNANLTGADLRGARLVKANLNRTDLEAAILVDTDLTAADLTGCRIYGISAWGLKLEGTKQENLVITPWYSSNITVDNIEVAQFIYLMLHNEKIRDVIDTITSKAVLILGRFTEERKAVLDALREELRKRDYLPILFDFAVPAERDITETVSLLARMARFIIADLTDPSSIPKELEAIVPGLAVPVQPLLEGSSRPYAMFKDYWKYEWVLPVYRYEGLEPLLATLAEKVIAPAEGKVKALAERRRMIEAELTKPQ